MSDTWDKILLFGDSITQESFSQQRGFGFSAALQNEYIRRLDVVNRGFSGYTTRQALKVLPSVIPSPKVARIRLFVVFFGANDASLPRAENKQHVPISEYRANIEKIITHPLIAVHEPRIVLITPASINEHLVWANDQNMGRTSLSRRNVDMKSYADTVVDIGQRLGVPVVNLWRAFMAMTPWREETWKSGEAMIGSLELPQDDALVELSHDGLHFSPAGYRILLKEFMRTIREKAPELAPERMKVILPLWNDTAAWEAWETVSKDGH